MSTPHPFVCFCPDVTIDPNNMQVTQGWHEGVELCPPQVTVATTISVCDDPFFFFKAKSMSQTEFKSHFLVFCALACCWDLLAIVILYLRLNMLKL